MQNITNIAQFLNDVKTSKNTKLLVFVSYQNPYIPPKLKINSFEEFKTLVQSEMNPTEIHEIQGVYSSLIETAAMLYFDKVPDHLAAFEIVDKAIALGANLGQDSILTSTVASNALWKCGSGHADYTGKGFKVFTDNAPPSYSIINDMKFSLNLDF